MTKKKHILELYALGNGVYGTPVEGGMKYLYEAKKYKRLIASAPELLEAVKQLAWFIENVNDDTPDRSELFFKARETWRNAIMKAEGK